MCITFSKKSLLFWKKKVLIQISWLLRKPADLGPNFFLPHDGQKSLLFWKKKVLIQISWLLRKPADVGPNFFLPHDGPRFKVEYDVYSFVKKKD